MKALSVSTYAALRKRVEETLLLGQQEIEEAKVLTYWNTGQLIDRHIRGHTPEGKERAAYNVRVVEKLAKDLKISDTVLYRCVRFAQQFKKVAARPLSWAHYRALITVSDETKRLALADRASKGEWSSRELEIEVRNLLWDERVEASEGKPPLLLPAPVIGPFFTYKIIRPETIHSRSNELLIDLGFSTVLELGRVSTAIFKPDAIVVSAKDPKGRYTLTEIRSLRGGGEPAAGLYTYQAFVERVVDGDTLKVEIDLGFNIRIRQTLRLRGIDCPELNKDSAAKKADPSLNSRPAQGGEGEAAKRFVERELAHCEFITLKSTQTRKEKWGRYLGDIFYTDKTGKQGYLNNLLLEKGMSVRVRE